MKLLSSLNKGDHMEIGRKVGIIGGGNTAVDAARRVLRTESSEGVSALDTARSALRTTQPDQVTIFYRRTMEEIPAYQEEVEGALGEGIQIEFLTAPKKIIVENGKMKGCEFIRMKLGEVDESGRRSPVPIEGSEFSVDLDTLIVSISENPDISFLEGTDLECTKWNTLESDPETFRTSRPGVFAGGDLVTGPNTVVDAVASGKIAAASMDQHLRGEEIRRVYSITRPSAYIKPCELTEQESEDLARAERPEMPVLSPEKRKYNLKEVHLGLTEKQAVTEARRCLRCELETKDGKKFIKDMADKTKTPQNADQD
jgi:NADPH-dependent glutamate synthase beta subunit-like oxidoreductase